jgi:hypothetical protein
MFNFTDTETSTLMPKGDYQAFVSSATWKESKAGDEYLEAVFTTVEKRNVFHSFNLLHKSDMPRNIAMVELKRLLLAAGFDNEALKFDSKEKLVEAVLTCRCVIGVDVKESEGYAPRNVVKSFKKIQEDSAEVPLDDNGKPIF